MCYRGRLGAQFVGLLLTNLYKLRPNLSCISTVYFLEIKQEKSKASRSRPQFTRAPRARTLCIERPGFVALLTWLPGTFALLERETIQPPPAPRPTSAPRLQAGLWVQISPNVEHIGLVLDLQQRVTAVVGRSREAQFPLDDSWQSRAHFRVSRQSPPPGSQAEPPWILEDLATRNGTFVNGERVTQVQLSPGDVVRAGASVFVFDTGAHEQANLGLVGCSAAIDRVRNQIRQFAPGMRPVHITGESGTGKELVAQALHAASGCAGSMLCLNMANIVANLAESQLFGHRRGAFSGAAHDLRGAFDVADQGTLLLDEVAELESSLQAKLLRAVESGEIHRIGDALPHRVQVRLLTATHRDLAQWVAENRFRTDLYWRIAHEIIDIAPLRDRPLDVAPLLEHFLTQAGLPTLTGILRTQAGAAWHAADLLERYLVYDWPGNVRELRQEALRLGDFMRQRLDRQATGPIPSLAEACSDRLLQLPPQSRRVPAAKPAADPAEIASFMEVLSDPAALRRSIQSRTSGNIKEFSELAGRALGRNPATVRRQLYRTLGLPPADTPLQD